MNTVKISVELMEEMEIYLMSTTKYETVPELVQAAVRLYLFQEELAQLNMNKSP